MTSPSSAVLASIHDFREISKRVYNQSNVESADLLIKMQDYNEVLKTGEEAFETLRIRLITINEAAFLTRVGMCASRVFLVGGAAYLVGQHVGKISNGNREKSTGLTKQLERVAKSPKLKKIAIAAVILGTAVEVCNFLRKTNPREQLNDFESPLVKSIVKDTWRKLDKEDQTYRVKKLIMSLTSSVIFKRSDKALALEILKIRTKWLDVYRDFAIFEQKYLNKRVGENDPPDIWLSFHKDSVNLSPAIEDNLRTSLTQRLIYINNICTKNIRNLVNAKSERPILHSCIDASHSMTSCA